MAALQGGLHINPSQEGTLPGAGLDPRAFNTFNSFGSNDGSVNSMGSMRGVQLSKALQQAQAGLLPEAQARSTPLRAPFGQSLPSLYCLCAVAGVVTCANHTCAVVLPSVWQIISKCLTVLLTIAVA